MQAIAVILVPTLMIPPADHGHARGRIAQIVAQIARLDGTRNRLCNVEDAAP
jgi:hypothetical protein